MEVVEGLQNLSGIERSVVTVGSFDGLHRGHQRIIRLMRQANAGHVTVLTFDPHPQTIVRPDVPPPPQLTTRKERLELFKRAKVDRLVIARFNHAFSELSAQEFVKQVLVDALKVKALFIGPNHHFGKGRAGDADLLRMMGKELGFTVDVVEPVVDRGEVVSSSRIRRKLLAGETEGACRMLGKPFYINGVVVHGEGRGRKLGFPTANLKWNEPGKLVPPSGIYATITELDGARWPSVVHIGPRPTFPGDEPTIESHLIGFDGDLYGKYLRVGLIGRLREIIAFESIAELIRQMELDRAEATEFIRKHGFAPDSRLSSKRLTEGNLAQ